MSDRQKISILPLHSAEHNLIADDEAFDLGFGVSVERCKGLLSSSDLWIWNHNRVQDDEAEINGWDTCLVHRYQSESVTGENDDTPITLLAYVLAHLRIINPHRDSVDDNIQLQQELPGSAYKGFRCSKAAFRPNRFLCDCENLVSGINRNHLNELKTFLPWVADFAPNWRIYQPLWISMYLFEEGYKPGHNLRTCFENGSVCGNGIVGVGVTVKGMVSSDRNNSTPVRLKFDNEEPARESWGISSDHDTLYPYGHEAQFLSQLILHKKLILEFSYYEKTPRAITFELSGLLDKMQAQGLQDPTPELEARRKAKSEADAKFAIQQAVQQKHLAAQQAVEQKNLKQERDAEEKRLSGLRAECAPYVNGPSPDMVQGKTYHLPPKECREILSWTHDGYIDVLYELQEQARIKHP